MPRQRGTHGKRPSPYMRLGQLGVNLIEKIVLNDLKCLWTPTQAASDVGIDGFIEICRADTGDATNLIVQVQSRATMGRWEDETGSSFCYRPKQRDLRHWLGGNSPVILIVSRPETGEAYWVSVKDYFSTPEKKEGLRIDFDKMKDVFGPATLYALQNLAVPRGSGLYLGPAPIEECLYSNLLPVSRYHQEIHEAETVHRERETVRAVLKTAGLKNSFAWFLKEGKIYSFFDLTKDPWNSLCVPGTSVSFPTSKWAESKNLLHKNDFAWLLGLAFRGFLGNLGIWFHQPDNGIGYYYYAPNDDLSDKVVAWKELKQSRRTVFAAYKSKKDPTRIMFYRHLGFDARFHRFAGEWYLEITPTYHFTKDGRNEHPFASDLNAKIKRIEKNAAVHAHVRFLSHVLTQSDLFSQNRLSSFFTLVQPMDFNVDFGIPEVEWIARADTEEKDLLGELDLDLNSLPLFDEH